MNNKDKIIFLEGLIRDVDKLNQKLQAELMNKTPKQPEKSSMEELDNKIMKEADKFLEEYLKERDFPADFDDITWIMHNFLRHYTQPSSEEQAVNPTQQDWRAEAKKHFNLVFSILEIPKQPNGNREEWIDQEIDFIASLITQAEQRVRGEIEEKILNLQEYAFTLGPEERGKLGFDTGVFYFKGDIDDLLTQLKNKPL